VPEGGCDNFLTYVVSSQILFLEPMGILQNKLSVWGSEEFGSLARTVRKLRSKLDRLRSNSVGRGPLDEEREQLLRS
jgi:hypothetical protein